MAKADTNQGTIQSDKTLFSIIELLYEKNTSGVTELANEIGISKGAVHKHLKTLEEAGYVSSNNGQYKLGFKFLTLGGKVRGMNSLCVASKNAIDEIADVTGELGTYAVYENGKCIYTYIRNDNYGITNRTLIGENVTLNQCAEGKAMLATLSDEKISKLEFESTTPYTSTSLESIYDDVEKIRNRGYALSTQEFVEGLNSIAVPVSHKDTLGAIAISGPANRLTTSRMESEYREILLSIVNEMELRIRHGQFNHLPDDF